MAPNWAEIVEAIAAAGTMLVAIGGITRENAGLVLAAGADSVAVIGDLFPKDGDVRRRADEWLRLTK